MRKSIPSRASVMGKSISTDMYSIAPLLPVVGLIDLPDSIAEAFFGFLADFAEAAAVTISGILTSELMTGLLVVPNPYASASAGNAWTGIFKIAIVMLPIMIALALIVWPFSEDRESGLMNMIVRMVMVLLFIGISQPAWGFAIDATNAVSVAILDLNPSAGSSSFGYGSGSLGASLTFGVWAVKLVVACFAAILALVAVALSIFFLLLRWFLVWMAYVGTPLFAVIWFVGGGPLKSVGDVGATFMRMGAYALLAGPIIAVIILVFEVFITGGILQTATGFMGNTGLLFAELALMMIFPVMLIVSIWKLISWAGQPIGAGEAATVATIAATAVAGGLAAGALGSGAAASGGAAAGSAGGGAAGGSAGGAAGAGGASASGASAGGAGTAGSANVGAGGSGLSSRITSRAKGVSSGLKQRGYSAMSSHSDHIGSGQKLSDAKSGLNEAQEQHQAASEEADFLQKSIASGEMDIAEANKYDFLPEEGIGEQEPKFSTDPETGNQKMSYATGDGNSATVNLTQAHSEAAERRYVAGQQVDEAKAEVEKLENAKGNADTVKKVTKPVGQAGKVAGRAGKAGGRGIYKAGEFTTRTGTSAMIGGVTGNPYLAYSSGRQAAEKMIGSNGPQQSPDIGAVTGGKPADNAADIGSGGTTE
jgi:type IV secretion system protein TrbL